MNLSNSRFKGAQSYLCVVVLLAFTCVLGSASAEIKLTDSLSVSGFLDMSSTTTSGGDETEIGLSFDQFELDFKIEQGSVTGYIDIDSTAAEGGIKLEQGYVTYALPESTVSGVSIKAGRFLSAMGFEAAEPTGLFQYSFSEGIPYPGYQNGIGIDVSPAKQVGIYVALLSGVWDVNDTDVKNPGIEAQVALTPMEQLTAKVGYAMDKMEDDSRSELNAWVQFTQGPFTLAGEIDMLRSWPAEDEEGMEFVGDGMHFLGMANVSLADMISAPVAVTLRFSGVSISEDSSNNADDADSKESTGTEFTLSPSYTVTDNWLLLAEFKRRLDAEETIIAVESLFTF